jgi:hypothetical protein
VCRQGKTLSDAAESENLCMRGNSKRENREILLVSDRHGGMSLAGRNDRKTFQTAQLI